MPTVIVASTNPVKIDCIQNAFAQMFPGSAHRIEGQKAPSGVPDQPMGTEETIQGARNRARYIREQYPDADFAVGIEGGLMTDEHNQLVAVAWIVIVDKNGFESKSATSTFVLPKRMADDVRSGMEMGLAADKLHGSTNIKQSLGTVGVLTDGIVDRTAYYTQAAILALIPFKNPLLYST